MKKDKTEIVIVLDRSGSMSSIARDSEGGLYSCAHDGAACSDMSFSAEDRAAAKVD